MGGSHSNQQDDYFRKVDWQLINMNESSVIWQNRRDPTQKIQQFNLYSSSQEEYNRQKQMYYLRKNHPHLVAAIFLNSQSTSQFCSSSYQQKLYIERIPIRLSDIQHIPFPDYLHVYNQCLRGYSQLANHVGFFAVEEEFIGINEQGLVKIWMNQDFSKDNIIGGKISQETMLRNVIDIIDRNADQNKGVPSVKNYIYQSSDKILFQEAIIRFNNYVRQYCNGVIPQKLQCIDRVGGIFAISNRIVSPANTVQYDQRSNMIQIQPQNITQINQNRPQLVDSAILNGRYQIPINQAQSSGHYQVFSNRLSEGSRSRPNILIPINQQNYVDVRQPSATFHNYNRQTINSFLQKSPSAIISQGRLQSRVAAVPTPVSPQPQPQQIKIMTINSPKASQNQNIFVNRVQNPVQNINQQAVQNIKINPNHNSSSFSQPQQSQTPQVQVPQQQIINIQRSQVQNQPLPITNQIKALNFTTRQQKKQSYQFYRPIIIQEQTKFKNLANQPQVIDLKQQVFQNNNPFSYNSGQSIISPKANRQSNQLLINSNAVSKNISLDQSPIIKGSNPSYSAINYNAEPLYPSYNSKNYSNSYIEEKSEFKAVNIDDGKSSSDFFKKLNQLGNIGETTKYENVKYQSKPYQIFEQINTIKQVKQEYKNPFSYNDTSNQELISYTQINYSNQFYSKPQQNKSQEQFGRNAVSNIFNIEKVSQGNSYNKFFEPLKFQNNLDMKYSIFKTQNYKNPTYNEPNYGNYAYRSYETNFDPDLLADINNLKE